MEKLIDGFNFTMSTMLTSSNVIFMVFEAMLFLRCLKRTKDPYYRMVAGVPLGISVMVSMGSCTNNAFFSSFLGLITSNTSVSAQNWTSLASYLPFCVYALVAFCTLLTFFNLSDDLSHIGECAFLCLLSLAVCVVMGFSPTLYASSKRTLVFGYFLLAWIALRVYSRNKDLLSPKERKLGSTFLKALCLMFFSITWRTFDAVCIAFAHGIPGAGYTCRAFPQPQLQTVFYLP